MPNAGPQGSHRKSLAVKHHDGEPLTRVDLQYDLLYYLFNNPKAVFTDPYITLHGEPAGTKVTFRDLYVNTLVHSPRCSKVSRDKLLETPAFADEFAKISLLSNVGRINTTMAFFPEMRTALRTYHPVPSLQKTDGNLQDAPRIKNILKSCLLPTELQNTPMTPADVLSRSRSGEVPPTTIVNLVFIVASHSAAIAQAHFPNHIHFDVLDFFSPINFSSESRARAFLWLLYHYYEAPSRNPFDDDTSRRHPGSIPNLEPLAPEEAALENVDSPEEKEWGVKMSEQRRLFLLNKDIVPIDEDGPSSSKPKDKATKRVRGRGRGKNAKVKESPSVALTPATSSRTTRDPSPSESTASMAPNTRLEGPVEGFSGLYPSLLSPQPVRLPPYLPPLSTSPLPPLTHTPYGGHLHSSVPFTDPFVRELPAPVHLRYPVGDVRDLRGDAVRSRGPTLPPLHYVESYTERSPPRLLPPLSLPPPSPLVPLARTPPTFSMPPDIDMMSPSAVQSLGPTRSMLQQAWHVVMNTDPLEDSEDELDENTRLDLLLRLRIISRLRGKEPTPEPELQRRQVDMMRSSPDGSSVTS